MGGGSTGCCLEERLGRHDVCGSRIQVFRVGRATSRRTSAELAVGIGKWDARRNCPAPLERLRFGQLVVEAGNKLEADVPAGAVGGHKHMR